MSDAGRYEYLQKIRTVEDLARNGGEYVTSQDSGGTPPVSPVTGEPPELPNTTYKIPPIKVWPEKIELPSMSRYEYNVLATKYAQANITNTEVFTTLDTSKFTLVHSPRFTGENMLRKDFVFYLSELHGLVAPKLGVSKLIITSTFRNQAHQDKIYSYKKPEDRPKSGPHMGGIAVDIGANGEDRYTIADTAYYMGFGGIAIGDGFVHIDISPKGYWGYDDIPIYRSPDRKYG